MNGWSLSKSKTFNNLKNSQLKSDILATSLTVDASPRGDEKRNVGESRQLVERAAQRTQKELAEFHFYLGQIHQMVTAFYLGHIFAVFSAISVRHEVEIASLISKGPFLYTAMAI